LDAVGPDGFEDGFVEEELIGEGFMGMKPLCCFFFLD
jgi:hypothetical protein